MQETIEWVACSERLPDDDTSVLICMRGTAEPTWIGWRTDGVWFDTDGERVEVIAWAAMPAGLRQAQEAAR